MTLSTVEPIKHGLRSARAGGAVEAAAYSFVVVAVSVAALSEIPTRWRVGSETLSAAWSTVAAAVGVVLAVLAAARARSHGVPALPAVLVVFLGWVGASLLWHHRSVTHWGVQFLAVTALFVATCVLSYTAVVTDARRWARVRRFYEFSTLPLALLYVLVLGTSGNFVDRWVSPRVSAISLLVAVAAIITDRGLPKLWRTVWCAGYGVLIAVGLSRTATVVAALVIAGGFMLQARWRSRIIALVAVAGLLAVFGVIAYGFTPPKKPVGQAATSHASSSARSTAVVGGDQGLRVGGLAVNTNGRREAWGYVWASARNNLVLGHGPGSASAVVERRMHGRLDQPHNDYLRLLHDLGAVGLVLVAAVAALVGRSAAWAWRRLPQGHVARSAAATMVLTTGAVGLMMITDNPIVYSWVMVPLSVVLGGGYAIVTLARRGTGAAQPQGAR